MRPGQIKVRVLQERLEGPAAPPLSEGKAMGGSVDIEVGRVGGMCGRIGGFLTFFSLNFPSSFFLFFAPSFPRQLLCSLVIIEQGNLNVGENVFSVRVMWSYF